MITKASRNLTYLLQRGRHLLSVLLCIPIISYYAFGLTRDVDPIILQQYDSAIFDMDYVRVAEDWTTYGIDTRNALYHPLYKLFMGPQVSLMHIFVPDTISAIRLLAVFYMSLYCILSASLSQYAVGKRSLLAYFGALLLGLASFPVMLFSGIPDTTLISGLATLIPYLVLVRFKDNEFTKFECAAWALSAVFGFGLTLTQVVHTFIAFTFRTRWAPVNRAQKMKLTFCFLSLATLTFFILEGIQILMYPTIWIDSTSVRFEGHFFSLRKLLSFSHIVDTVGQCLIYPFMAPGTKYSPWYFNQFGGAYNFVSMIPPNRAHLAIMILLVVSALVLIRKTSLPTRVLICKNPLIPMALSVTAMLVLHILYGREFIMYSSNWHGLTIVIVTSVMVNLIQTISRLHTRIAVQVVALIIIGLMGQNNLSALREAYQLAKPDSLAVKRNWQIKSKN